MKEAELSVALLNGFGTESADKTDMDDMRRLQRFNAKQTKKKNPLFSHQRETLLARIRKKLNERANAGDVGPKDVINIMLEERRRSTKIKNGGLDAAKILASGDGDGTSADIKPGEVSLLDICIYKPSLFIIIHSFFCFGRHPLPVHSLA